jgi:hypothetical protein
MYVIFNKYIKVLHNEYHVIYLYLLKCIICYYINKILLLQQIKSFNYFCYSFINYETLEFSLEFQE